VAHLGDRVRDRVRDALTSEGQAHRPPPSTGRRWFLVASVVGLAAGASGALAALVRSLVPAVLYEPPSRFPVGRPEDFPPRSTTFVAERRLFVFNSPEGFHVVSAVCTHLGCNLTFVEGRGFECPCHGSAFDADGRVVTGPAAWPLPRYAVSLSRRGELVVNTRQRVSGDFRLKV
jgi:cytochrome b6-f complex iron-sulfur subunit